MTTRPIAQDVARTTLAVLFIGALLTASLWTLRPFLVSTVWATIIVVATWPTLLKLQERFGGRRGPAVAVMTAILLLFIVGPLTAAVTAIAGEAENIAAKVKALSVVTVPPPPEWVPSIPLIGSRLASRWQQYAALGTEELSALVTPYARTIANWFLAKAGSVAALLLQLLLTVVISAVLYAGGEKGAAGVLGFARRLAGSDGEEVAVLAARATRGVALGIVVTAVLQSLLSGIGLAIAGVPAAALLTGVIFVLCLAQVGPILVLAPSVGWLYWKGDPVWGTVLLIFTVVAGGMDNFVRPVLIKKGADLPLLMIFAGVIGGLLAFGIVGLFIGPVVLAVTFTLLQVWVSGDGAEEQ